MKKFVMYVMCFTAGMMLLSCKKDPVGMTFANMKCCDAVYQNDLDEANDSIKNKGKSRSEVFLECTGGTCAKAGVVFSARLKAPVGAPAVKYQVRRLPDGLVIHPWEGKVAPDATVIEGIYNMPFKGKFRIEALVKDDVIARGEIELK